MCDSENHTEICFYREGGFFVLSPKCRSIGKTPHIMLHYAAALSVGTADLESKQ